jgi:L-fuconolactonase
MIIDAHHHFWKYDPVEYGWISGEMKVLRRDFLPSDLLEEIKKAGVDGVVSVQARQTTEETKWLLELAARNDFIRGVVGWLPLRDRSFPALLESFSQDKKLVSLRHVVQDEPDPDFLLRTDFNAGIRELRKYDLVYDILIYPHQLPAAITFADLHPSQLFVLDHLAKPLIRYNTLDPWKDHIIELSRRENVYCKISGMVTEADYENWTTDQLLPYFKVCLDAFGSKRLLFGSDWPVCLLASGYGSWLKAVKYFISSLSRDEQDDILFRNAARGYRLIP